MKQQLLPLLTALYFSGAHTSGTTVPPVPWTTLPRRAKHTVRPA